MHRIIAHIVTRSRITTAPIVRGTVWRVPRAAVTGNAARTVPARVTPTTT